jgi:hypothetical protein
MGLLHNGLKHTSLVYLLDDGANVGLATLAAVEKLGIPFERRQIGLVTSMGGSQVIGVTAPVDMHYGSHEKGYAVRQCFLIVADSRGLYDILVSNAEFQACHGIIDSKAQTMVLRPEGRPPVSIATIIRK